MILGVREIAPYASRLVGLGWTFVQRAGGVGGREEEGEPRTGGYETARTTAIPIRTNQSNYSRKYEGH